MHKRSLSSVLYVKFIKNSSRTYSGTMITALRNYCQNYRQNHVQYDQNTSKTKVQNRGTLSF